MESGELEHLARDIAPWLILTAVVAGDGAMKWTSPYTGTSCIVHPDGAWFVVRRDAEGTAVAARGFGSAEVADAYLRAPQSLPAREAAARAVVEVDLAAGLGAAGAAVPAAAIDHRAAS